LGLFIPVIQFRRSRNSLKTLKVAPPDWFIMIIANIFVTATVVITGGMNSALLVFFLVPLIFFTAEFGLKMGSLNLIPMGSFILFNLLFSQNLPVSSWLQLSTLLMLSGVLLLAVRSEIKVKTHYQHKIYRILHRDELTGLGNRRYLKAIIRQAMKKQSPFVLIMMDINYFKYFNDYWGHPRGDSLLIQISHLIREAVTENDTVIRYSGDEFILVSPGDHNIQAPGEQIERMIRAIDKKVKETHFPGAECFPSQELTLSYGAALYPDEATSYEDLIHVADQALYRNKQSR
jgi:diguanylate cyclase (GGDEF)-like protein